MSDRTLTDDERAANERRGPRLQQRGPGSAAAQPVEKAQNFGVTARRLLGLLRGERTVVISAIALGVVSVVLSALGPLVIGRITDLIFAGFVGARLPEGASVQDVADGLRARGEAEQAEMLESMPFLTPGQGIDFDGVAATTIWAIALYAVAGLFMWAQARMLVGAVNRVIYDLRQDAERKIHALPLPYVDKQPRGELLSRVTNDIDNVAQSLQQTLSQLLNNGLTVLAMLGLMMYVSPWLSLIAIISIPISVALVAVIGRRSQGFFRTQWKATGDVNSVVEEAFSGHALVKVFGRADDAQARFEVRNEELRTAGRSAQFVSGIIMPTMMFVGNLSYVAIAVVGALRVSSGAMTLGGVVAFIQYSRQFTQPLTQLTSMANLVQSGVASAERVFDLLDAPEEPKQQRVAERGDEGPRGRVVFEDVSFSYSPDVPLIEGLNLTVEPGQRVAIVGPTGAGKTTLVNLIMRFYELDGGRITVDGTDIATMSREQLRERMGMVLQDTWLFMGSIEDNIAYGKVGATPQEVRAAAEAAYVDRFVHALPDGYATELGDDAGSMSAGERQLVTIARAFLSEPQILILDEATSSVDTRTEKLIQGAMDKLASTRTSFIIAHRLSTIRDADVIVVMEAGRIVEQGTHDDLMARGGTYAALNNA